MRRHVQVDRLEGLDVVAAGGPVQWGFGVRSGEPTVDVRPGVDQTAMVVATVG
jgi:hypothetical protein